MLANDYDPDGDEITIDAFTHGTHGNVTLSNGTLTYTPGEGYSVSDAFTYTITDGNNATMTARVFVQVHTVKRGPEF